MEHRCSRQNDKTDKRRENTRIWGGNVNKINLSSSWPIKHSGKQASSSWPRSWPTAMPIWHQQQCILRVFSIHRQPRQSTVHHFAVSVLHATPHWRNDRPFGLNSEQRSSIRAKPTYVLSKDAPDDIPLIYTVDGHHRSTDQQWRPNVRLPPQIRCPTLIHKMNYRINMNKYFTRASATPPPANNLKWR